MLFELSELSVFAQVIFIDIALAGDNAIVVGLAAAGLAPEQRKKAVLIGISFALACRIVAAIFTTQLLNVPGLLFLGGLVLLWVGWRLGAEILQHEVDELQKAEKPAKDLRTAIWRIAVADITMSIDNVLAVAGAARHHLTALAFGLVLSIILMGVAASAIAKLMHRFPWIKGVGVAVVVFVALKMMWEGWPELPELAHGLGFA